MLRGAVAFVIACAIPGGFAVADERQITFSPKNHMLDNNDNFSPDGRFIAYDTRETIGPGIDNSQSVEMVEIESGVETILYEAIDPIVGNQAAPGIAAVSFSPVAMEVGFIHGPPSGTVDERGFYGKPNRNGGLVPADGTRVLQWMDHRDVTSSVTPPGAHRGGTHRHEFSLDGRRIGFTYDDFLLPEYDRSIGYMERHIGAPGDASHYFVMMIPTVPKGTAKPGELEKGYGDSWVGREGLMRAFIGKVMEENGEYMESLFVADIPREVDITTADSGTISRYPTPPAGITVRRLTHTPVFGIARGTADGTRIAYMAEDADGVRQVYSIASTGSDRDPNPYNRPHKVTRLEGGIIEDSPGARWHPSGKYIAVMHDGGVAVVHAEIGPKLGDVFYITPHGDGIVRDQICWSPDGKFVAYNRPIETSGPGGEIAKTYDGKNFTQIFLAPFDEWLFE